MKRLQLLRWSGSVLSPRTRSSLNAARAPLCWRCQSTAVAVQQPALDDTTSIAEMKEKHLQSMPSPPPYRALTSAKLSALHARLALPRRFPLQTLARCLVDASAEPNPDFSNFSLAILGRDILGFHTSELILAKYPRLPLPIVFTTLQGYAGPGTCAALTREWGVDFAAEPGGEVDPGLLQFKRVMPGNSDPTGTGRLVKDMLPAGQSIRKFVTSGKIKDTDFGRLGSRRDAPTALDLAERPELQGKQPSAGVTMEEACANFVRALFGAMYLHTGRDAARAFFDAHVRSRKLDVSKMFIFKQPTRDLSRLCAREGFDSPVARILSETGRDSRHPVYIVGVFSGREKLGEGAGGSLDEARIRAAISAMKGWYMYSPLETKVPSDTEGGKSAGWEPLTVDGGEVIV